MPLLLLLLLLLLYLIEPMLLLTVVARAHHLLAEGVETGIGANYLGLVGPALNYTEHGSLYHGGNDGEKCVSSGGVSTTLSRKIERGGRHLVGLHIFQGTASHCKLISHTV
jgi:hypothetical protein